MDVDTILVLATALEVYRQMVVFDDEMARKRRRRPRKYWVRPWLERKNASLYHTWVQEVALEDPAEFVLYHRYIQ